MRIANGFRPFGKIPVLIKKKEVSVYEKLKEIGVDGRDSPVQHSGGFRQRG
jgi:hypothetical protein